MPRRLLLVPGLLLALAVPAAADGPNETGYTDLNKEYSETAGRDLRSALFRGVGEEKRITPGKVGDKKHEAAIDGEARWLTYRLYYEDFHKASTGQPADRSIDRVFKDLDGTLTNLTRGKAQTGDTPKMFVAAMCKRAREVMDAPAAKPIAVMNAARMLAYLAPLAQPELADALAAVVKEPPQRNQGAQYWACRGLRDLLAGAPLPPEKLEAAAVALADLVGQKVTFNPSASATEIDGYRALRREAIRALAQTRLPSLGDKGRPALALLKLMAQDETGPEPRIDERVEAAIGLARMRPTQKPEEYNADYAAYHIGLLVVDFGSFYQTEARKTGLPVRTLAARLSEELEKLRTDVKDAAVAKTVTESLRALGAIEAGGTVNVTALDDAIKALKPANQELFKGVKSAVEWHAYKPPAN